MGLLEKLWDDTVAGPRPDTGLGKLRKQSTFTFRQNSGKESGGGNGISDVDDISNEAVRITRSIMIVKPPGIQTQGNASPQASPAGSTPPVSPFSGGSESYRFRWKSTSDVYERARWTGPRSPPPPYDE